MKKIKGYMQKRCHTGQYTGKIIRGKGGREGNGHIYLYIRTEDGRERERKGTDTGTEGRNPGRKGWEKDEQARNNKAIGSYLRYANDT